MNKFWAAQSSSEDEKGSDDESYEQQQNQKATGGRFGANFEDSDSDSEDEQRVVKNKKDKAWDSMKEAIVRLKNARKNGDWPVIQDEFANVNKMIEKSKMLIVKNGIPPFYIKMLAEVEDNVKQALTDKEAIKKMKPVVSRALNQMKLQVRKHNDNYKDQIADFREHPEKYEEDEDEDSSEEDDDDDDDDDDSDDSDEDSSDDSDDSDKKPKAKTPTKAVVAKKPVAKDSEDESEDSLFGNESDSESSSSSEDERKELKGRARWLKKTVDTATQGARDAKREAKKLQQQQQQQQQSKRKDFDKIQPKKVVTTYYHDDKMTEEELDKKVNELVAARGRKNTDSREILRQLEVLTKAARHHGAKKEIPILMHLISSMFDAHRSIDDFMDLQQWRTCLRSLTRIVHLLEQHKKLILGTIASDEVADIGALKPKIAIADNDVETEKVNPNILKVVGSMESFALRLEDEYIKSLQQINPHTQEYVIRLSDEASLIELAESILNYYKRVNDTKAAATLSLLIVEHMYYKHETHAAAVQRAHLFNKTWGRYNDLHPACSGKNTSATSKVSKTKGREQQQITHPGSWLGNPVVTPPPYNPAKTLEDLCNYIFKYGDERFKTRALLCSVYHHALHDRYYRARDLFLISHVQEFIDKAEIKTQILYNRTVATLGLSAFRMGLFQKAFDCLSGICTGRMKELLAQGQGKWPDKDPEQEKIERRRQIPYHMHINPDLLECCHMTCAMLLELPNLARASGSSSSAAANNNQNVISRAFRKYLFQYGRQVFLGPPENTREHVLAATTALLAGDWQKACDFILKLEVWNLIPNEGGERVKAMLKARVKEEAVRTYLLLNSDHYDSLSLTHICTMFDMDESTAKRIISRMIFNREISAAWDPNNILVMYKIDVSPLQVAAQNVTEKITSLVESNERLLDPINGVYGYKDNSDWKDNNRYNKQWINKDGTTNTSGTGGGDKLTGGGDINRHKYRNAGLRRPQPTNNRQSTQKGKTGYGNKLGGGSNNTTSIKPQANIASKVAPAGNTSSLNAAAVSNKPAVVKTDAQQQQTQQQPKRWGSVV